MQDTLIEFEANTAFTSAFAYNLFMAEAKKADAFIEKDGKGFVKYDWLSDFAHVCETDESYKLKKYRPKHRVYAPYSFVDISEHMTDKLKTLPIAYYRTGMFNPVINDTSPDKLSFYSYAAQADNTDLFESISLGSNSIHVLKPSLSGLPIDVKNKIKATCLTFEYEGHILAMYLYPNIVMFTHKFNKGITRITPEVQDMYKELFKWLEHVHITDVENTKALMQDSARKIAMQSMLTHYDKAVSQAKSEIASLNSNIESYKLQLHNAYLDIETKEHMVHSFTTDKDKLVQQAVDEIQKTEEYPFITKVEFTSTSLIFYTKEMIMTPPDGWEDAVRSRVDEKEYKKLKDNPARKVGPFKIEIKYSSSSVTILPHDGAPRPDGYFGASCHPHINTSGNPCWGSAASTISELHAKREYSMLLLFIINYLRTCNPQDSAGRSFYRWPAAE